MHRSIRGMLFAATVAALWGCGDDPLADNAGDAVGVRSSLTSMFINQGSTENVTIELVDGQGSAMLTSFSAVSNDPGAVTIEVDSSFNPIYVGDTLRIPDEFTRARFRVTGVELGNYSVTVLAGGFEKTIPVQVRPVNANVSFEPATPAPGDTVTVTLLEPLLQFTANPRIFFAGAPPGVPGANAIFIDAAGDGKSFRFIPAPTINSEGRLDSVITTAQPGITPVRLTTAIPLQLTSAGLMLDTLNGLFSTTAPAVGEVVTVTLPAGLKFLPTTAVTFPNLQGPADTPPADVVVAADSNSIEFAVGPNVDVSPQFSQVIVEGAPQFIYTRSGGTPFVTDEVADMPLAFDDNAPDAGQDIVVTAPGFKFLPNVQVDFGGLPAGIVSIAGDSSTVTIRPMPGSSGSGTWTNVAVEGGEKFALASLPGSGETVAVPNAAPPVPLVGTAAAGTAPNFAGPSVIGSRIAIVDAYPLANQFYKFTAPVAGKYRVQLYWQDGDPACVSDVDLGTSIGNSGTCAHPEQTSAAPAAPIAAGTVVTMVSAIYAVPAQPDWLMLVITRLPD